MHHEEFERLTHLCCFDLTAEEKTQLSFMLDKILEYMHSLSQVNTEGVPPTVHVLMEQIAPLRPDAPQRTLAQEELLRNAPASVAGFVKIPAILQVVDEGV